MMTHQTVTQLRGLRLDGMARAFEEQLTQPAASALAFEERFALLVDRELAWRATRRLERLLKQAKLKYGDAGMRQYYSGANNSRLGYVVKPSDPITPTPPAPPPRSKRK